ncbi:hypothetical protein MOQ_004417 [Trypanosoma cruzi marinkellei]|uniref:Integral membrane bound transporter domain-containing protein n=1 Tax=Trypanosoma cruzi marinkellei TaxID=85056 RepID=K2M9L2_TRYCR|nr:hypothetical protein MOQ_004417 [Trypanosoma cruzi marinkellei]
MPGNHAEKGNGNGRRNNDKATTISEGLISLDGEMSSFDDTIDKQNYHKENGSFGLPRYVARYPFDQSRRESVLNVPWHLRKPRGLETCTFFDSFRSLKFWKQSEFALRITLFAVLLPASLIAAELPNLPFVSNTHCLSAAVLASKVTVGEGLAYVVTWTRAGCIWLPLATIGAAANLGDSIVGWCFFYTLLLFIMAIFTENMVRRICLLLFNSCMFGILMDPKRGTVYPSRVMSDWCIGTGLCLIATFLPYPVFSKNKAHGALAEIARNTGTALTGMTSCFWSESNVTRNMAMTKVRMMTAAIDQLMQKFHTAHEGSFYEFIFEGFEPWDVREAKVKLFERLRANLRGLSRVFDIVESKPWVVDDSERSRAFGALIQSHVLRFSTSLDKLTEELASTSSFGQIRQLHSYFVELNDVTVKLQQEFDQARRRLFYENKPGTLEEFVPLMTFFIFSIVNFRDTMLQFDSEVQHRKHLLRNSIKRVVDKTMLEPIQDTFRFCQRLVTQWRRREIQNLIEAAKVSAAMILTVGFSFLIGIDKKSLSGPNIIAFVSGANPVEALQASIVRLTACILGTVMGFFAGSYSTTAVQKVASLCVLMFLGTFFRTDKDYGIMAVYAMFVLIPLDTVGHTTTEDTLARMNQITFGILIYVSISVIVLPLSPGLILRKKRINILLRVSEALTSLCDMFSEPLPIDSIHSTTIPIYRESITIDNHYDSSNPPDSDFLKNASTRLMVRIDRPMLKISELLDEIESRLEATYPFMGFARAERGIVDADYPQKACEKTTYHLYRIVSLLRTAWCSWEVLRSQKHYAPDTRHVLHCLQPIAWDACRSFQRFVGMLCYSLRNPQVSLEMELIQVVLELIQATEELHLRKNQMMLFIICKSVEKHARDKKEPGFFAADVTTMQSPTHKGNGLMALGGLGRGRVDDGGSILPLLRKGTNPNLQEDNSPKPPESVSLSDSFVMPITGADAEGLHSFTLSMQMFADETKRLLMCLEEMLEHLRKKM